MEIPTIKQQRHGLEFGDIFIFRDDETDEVIVMDTFRWDDPETLATFTGEDAWEKGMEVVESMPTKTIRKGGRLGTIWTT